MDHPTGDSGRRNPEGRREAEEEAKEGEPGADRRERGRLRAFSA